MGFNRVENEKEIDNQSLTLIYINYYISRGSGAPTRNLYFRRVLLYAVELSLHTIVIIDMIRAFIIFSNKDLKDRMIFL